MTARRGNPAVQEKIRYLIHEEKLSRREIADKLGYKHEDYITHLMRGIRSLPANKEPILNELVRDAGEKVVITVTEIVPGEYDRQAMKITQMMAQEAGKRDAEDLENLIFDKAEEVEEMEERKGGTPGLYYFKVFVTKDPVEKIKDFYRGKDEKIIGIYRTAEASKVLGGMYVTMHEGVNQKSYAQNVLKIIGEMERKGKI